MKWTIFIREGYEPDEVLGRVWTVGYQFYVKDLTKIDIKTNWRTKEIKDQRLEGILVGIAENLVFPIEYPITLKSGLKIDRPKFQRPDKV